MPREPLILTESRVRELIEDAIRQRLRAGFNRNLIDLLNVSAPIVILNPGSAGASIGLAFDSDFFSVDGAGQLTFDGAAIVQALSDLDDVDTSGVMDGQILRYNNTASEWQPNDLPSVPSNLADLDDVHDAAPSDNDVLAWNAGESRWEPTLPSGGGATELSDLSDVDTTGVLDEHILSYNNTVGEWQPVAPPTVPDVLSDLSDVHDAAPDNDDVLTWVAANNRWEPAAPTGGGDPADGDTLISTQVFEVSSTWTKPIGATRVVVELLGGGGGGGGTTATGSGQAAVAAGGGSGAYAKAWIKASDLGNSESVTVGGGGSGAASGNNSGAAGQASTFVTISAGGGGGGLGMTGTAGNGAATGGSGGAATGGDLNASGSSGYGGVVITGLRIQFGHGAASMFGGMTQSGTNQNGINAELYGGGGSGAASRASEGARPGGAGSDGVVIIQTYGIPEGDPGPG